MLWNNISLDQGKLFHSHIILACSRHFDLCWRIAGISTSPVDYYRLDVFARSGWVTQVCELVLEIFWSCISRNPVLLLLGERFIRMPEWMKKCWDDRKIQVWIKAKKYPPEGFIEIDRYTVRVGDKSHSDFPGETIRSYVQPLHSAYDIEWSNAYTEIHELEKLGLPWGH